jgi:uncharacterized protein
MSPTATAPTRLRALQRTFAAHVRDPQHAPAPGDVEPRRMAIYAELCFNNIESLLAANFPVIRTLHDGAEWLALVRDFYANHRAATPLFTQVAREFIDHLERRAGTGCGDAHFLPELARYEWAELALAIDEQEIDAADCDPLGDVMEGTPYVSPLAHVLAFRFPVQRIGPEFRPASAPPSPTLLLLVRDRSNEVRFHEVDALTALLLERLATNGGTGRECLAALLRELGREGDPGLFASGLGVLALLRERDALLGTRKRACARGEPVG